MKKLHWTSNDLALLPDDGSRYEIIGGELYVSKQPHLHHQIVCGKVVTILQQWCDQAQTGIPIFEPRIIFTDDNDMVPDVVWISYDRLTTALKKDGKLQSCPNLS